MRMCPTRLQFTIDGTDGRNRWAQLLAVPAIGSSSNLLWLAMESLITAVEGQY
jgi:hypothetical protein